MFKDIKEQFEKEKPTMESAVLTFHGVDGYDVYNCSLPFYFSDGKRYIYGRVEKRGEWSRSRTMLFEETGPDDWTKVEGSDSLPIEDPNVASIGGQLLLSGVHVMHGKQRPAYFYNYFYKGTDLNDMYYFETGPKDMKDIRLVELPGGRIGLFSRPRGEEIMKKYGCESMVGYAEINSLDELCSDVIDNAEYISGMFADGEWGGANQLYYLDSGYIGVIGHQCYPIPQENANPIQVYANMAFIFDPKQHKVIHSKVIGTRSCYPDYPAKLPHLVDCAFTGGIVPRSDGKYDLYSGIGDTGEGRLVIDYPFEGYGNIVVFDKDTSCVHL